MEKHNYDLKQKKQPFLAIMGWNWHWTHMLSSSFFIHRYRHHWVWYRWQQLFIILVLVFCSQTSHVLYIYQLHYSTPLTLLLSSWNLFSSWSIWLSTSFLSKLDLLARREWFLFARFGAANLPFLNFKLLIDCYNIDWASSFCCHDWHQ